MVAVYGRFCVYFGAHRHDPLTFTFSQVVVLNLRERDVAAVRAKLGLEDTNNVKNLLVMAFVGLSSDEEMPSKAMLNALHDLCRTRCAY